MHIRLMLRQIRFICQMELNVLVLFNTHHTYVSAKALQPQNALHGVSSILTIQHTNEVSMIVIMIISHLPFAIRPQSRLQQYQNATL